MKSIVICVDFDDLLKITLPRNRQFFEKTLVVTSPKDRKTQEFCFFEGIDCFETDAFYRNGAAFNKGLAMEEGLDKLGRDDWIVIWDADTLFPFDMEFPELEIGKLYGPKRRICSDIQAFNLSDNWDKYPLNTTDVNEFPGFFQLFNAFDPVLHIRPWYSTNWKHAGGCDSDFQSLWRSQDKIKLPFEVLHLGDHGQNWHGRATLRTDGSKPENYDKHKAEQAKMFELRKKYRYQKEKI
jgi:hypothetical protein